MVLTKLRGIHVYVFLTILSTFSPLIDSQCAVGNNIIVGNDPCNYSIVATPFFYSNESFQAIIAPPLLVLSGDFIYMGVYLNSTSEQTDHLLLETCWATRGRNHLVHNITDAVVDFPGCPSRRWRSVVRMTNNGQSSFVTIRFPIFFLFPDDREFYLHCSVGACDNCEPTECSSPAQVPQTYTRAAEVVTIGPVQRTDLPVTTNNNNPEQNTTGYLIAACVLAGLVFLIIIVVLLYCILSSNKKEIFPDPSSKTSSVPVLISKTRITSYTEESSFPASVAATSGGYTAQNHNAAENNVKQHEITV